MALFPGARSQDNLPPPESNEAPGPYPPPSDPRLQQPSADPRSMSTSQLDYQNVPNMGPQRHAKSTSTLPRSAQGDGAPPGPAPGLQQQHYSSQPNLNRDEGRMYENYPSDRPSPGPQQASRPQPQPQPRPRRRGPDIKPAQSMPNVVETGEGAPRGEGTRPKSEEIDHSRAAVKEWQQRNEQAEMWGQRYGNQPGTDPRDIPRTQINNQQLQPDYYQNTTPRIQEPQPPFNQLRDPMEGQDRSRQLPVSKPVPASRPSFTPQEVPRVDVDNRRSQPQFYDPRQASPQPQSRLSQQQQPEPLSYPSQQKYPPASQQSQIPNPYNTGQRGMDGRPDPNIDRSPDLPPPPPPDSPPAVPPLPQDLRGLGEDLPPPPQQGPDQSLQRRDGPTPQGHQQRGSGYEAYPDPSQRGPPPSNYQNLPGPAKSPHLGPPQPQQRPPYTESQPRSPAEEHDLSLSYHYAPRPAPSALDANKQSKPQASLQKPPAQISDPMAGKKKPPPPVAAKPKGLSVGPRQSSPWEQEQKEKNEKEQKSHQRDREIQELEQRPSLTQEEEGRLNRLKLDREFDRRAQEAEDGDSDTDMVQSAGVGMPRIARNHNIIYLTVSDILLYKEH